MLENYSLNLFLIVVTITLAFNVNSTLLMIKILLSACASNKPDVPKSDLLLLSVVRKADSLRSVQ